jgi:opacity protein-like surface antigen
MKRTLCCILVLLGTVQLGRAQFSVGFGAHGGISMASFPPDVKDFYGIGFGGGAHLDLNVLRFLSIRLNGDYLTFTSDKNKIKELLVQQFTVDGAAADPAKTEYDGLNAGIITISLNGIGKIPTGTIVVPYGLIGVGVNMMSLSDHKVTYTGKGDITQPLIDLKIIGKPESQTKVGLNFGGGVEFQLGKVKLFVEAKYVMIFTPDNKTNHLPITIGIGI